jgi:hypothetical protein
MGTPARPSKTEEYAPTLLSWIRGGLSRTKDGTQLNPRMGQVNVGVRAPQRGSLRLPGGLVWLVLMIVLLAIAVMVVIPAISGLVSGLESGLGR